MGPHSLLSRRGFNFPSTFSEEQAIEVEALEVTEITVEETVIEGTEELTEEVTPESEDKPDETK